MATTTPIGVEAVVKNVSGYISDLGRMESANQQFGSATLNLSPRIDQLRGRLGNLRTETVAFDDQVATATSAVGMLQGAFQLLADAGIVYATKRMAEAAFELATLGAEVARVEDSFSRVATAMGNNADAMFSAMDAATGHVIDDEDMMQAATNAMLMGLKLTEQQWADLAKGVQYHARLTGQSASELFSSVLEAISRGQPRMLTALKFPGAKDAINALGDSLDEATTSLTESQRQAAIFGVTMKVITDEMATYGAMAPDLITKTDQFREAWQRFKEEVGKTIAGGEVFGDLTLGLQILAAGMRGEIPMGEALTVTFLKSRGAMADFLKELEKQRALFPQAADEGQRYRDILTKIFPEPIDALARANMRLRAALPKVSDAEGWKKLMEQWAKADAAAAAIRRIGVATKDTADKMREAMYGGLETRGDEMVALAKVDAEILGNNEKLADDTLKLQEDAAEKAADAWESAWDDLLSNVQSALQETEVTIWDIALGENYQVKWDENRRRLEAIMARGFSELQAHPDWESILAIPEDVMRGTQVQLQDWARGQIAAGPGAWGNVDAAVEVVRQFMTQKAATEAFYNQVAAEYAARYGVPIGAGKAAVTGALGGTEEKAKAASGAVGTAIVDGIQTGALTAWPGFETWILGQVAALVTAINTMLDIHSPSGVFADIGQNMVAGLQRGMTAMPVMLPARGGSASRVTYMGGDTNTQYIQDPQTLYLAMAIQDDRRRQRWNAGMGVGA